MVRGNLCSKLVTLVVSRGTVVRVAVRAFMPARCVLLTYVGRNTVSDSLLGGPGGQLCGHAWIVLFGLCPQ